ncbi:MAG: MASE1 domain-containing protein [Chloroflexi bacterium]|nr:MASE1 domain-containing protein [Chloroflexota bacterium]
MTKPHKSHLIQTKTIAVYLAKILMLAVIYHLAARVGLKMAYVQANTSPVWPPTGIGLAALLIFGYWLWPGISLGILIGSLLTGAPFSLALGITIGNTLEVLVAVTLLKKFVGLHNEIDRIQDVVGLVLISLVCTTIGASIGTITLMLTGNGAWQTFWAIWVTWWIGDLLGALVVAPMLLTWLSFPYARLHKRVHIEAGLLLILLAVVTWYVFSSLPLSGVYHQAMIYVIFPFVIWAALRFGQRGATIAIFLVSGIAIWGTSQGMGPFSLDSKNDSLVLLQTFMAVVSLTALILAAATIERRKATDELQQRVEDLATLNDSSKTFLDNFEITNIFKAICQLAVTRLGLDVAWIETREDTSSTLATVYGIAPGSIRDLKAIWQDIDPQEKTLHPVVKTLDDISPSGERAETPYQSYAVFPLLFSNRLIGTLRLLSKRKDFFAKDNQVLMESYANLAAVALQNTLLFDEIRRSNRQLHGLSQRLMKAQEEERLNLSRELHDESGQLLTALTVQLGLLERSVDQPGALRQRIDVLKNTANTIQDNLHKLAVNLRPASLDHLGLVTTVRQFIAEFNRQYDIPVDFEAVGMEGIRLPIEVETALFRIIQESLTNVVLHAQATRVDVLLSLHNQHVVTIVEDDGIGFLESSPSLEDHLGLFGMRERIEMLGGTFTIESSPGKGTTVKAEVPCDD